ncbi:Nn.00g041300.m01.CDS01 [Neocucurbitaria sp. VM-36]
MFARVFDTAKRILSRSPSAQRPSSEIPDTRSINDAITPGADVAMVTTRGGTETPGAATPRSSGKKRAGKRELEALDTPTQVKRQRKSAPTPRKKVVDETPEPDTQAEEPAQTGVEEASDTIAVAVPSQADATKEEDLPIRRRTSPKVVVARASPRTSTGAESVEETSQHHVPTSTQETDFHTPEQHSGSVYATPATHLQAGASPTPKGRTTKHPKSASAKKSSGRKKKVEEDNASNTLEVTQITSRFLDEVPSSTYESDQATPKKEHVRFGSEEPVHTQDAKQYKMPEITKEAAATETLQDDDDSSDSDEAPEIVTAATATTKAKAAQAEADRALRAQQIEEQAKRRQREERIAEQQAQKRIREEKKAQKIAKQLAKQQTATASSEYEDEASTNRQDIFRDMKSLPALLPDSLLETIDDQRPPTPPPQRRGKTEEELRRERLNHHIKFLERSEKPAKDVKRGKLSVAVLGQQNRVLPPKANRDTRNVRELWLKGRKVEQRKGGKASLKHRKMERKAHGSRGFLRGGDD